jgi:hypothetical protein
VKSVFVLLVLPEESMVVTKARELYHGTSRYCTASDRASESPSFAATRSASRLASFSFFACNSATLLLLSISSLAEFQSRIRHNRLCSSYFFARSLFRSLYMHSVASISHLIHLTPPEHFVRIRRHLSHACATRGRESMLEEVYRGVIQLMMSIL